MTKSKVLGAIVTSAILLNVLGQTSVNNKEDDYIKYEPITDSAMVTIASREPNKDLYYGIVTNGFSDIVIHSAVTDKQNVNVPNTEYLTFDCKTDNNPDDEYADTYVVDRHKEDCGNMFNFSAEDLVDCNLYLCDKCFDIKDTKDIANNPKVQQYYHTMDYGYPEENIYPKSGIVNHESLDYHALSELDRTMD